MGALKLTYYEAKNPLKIVYSKTLEEQKSVQRFLSPDPIGIGDGVNVYAYCHNNPVNGTDTSGTQFNKPYIAKQDNARAQPSIDFKTLMQAGEKQAAANTAKAAAEHNRQVNSNNSNFYGSNDPAYYAIKGDNEMAKFVATKNLAQKEGGVMGILIWTGYGLDKVGEYGAPLVAGGSALKGNSGRLPARETNFKAPIEPSGNTAASSKPQAARVATPVYDGRQPEIKPGQGRPIAQVNPRHNLSSDAVAKGISKGATLAPKSIIDQSVKDYNQGNFIKTKDGNVLINGRLFGLKNEGKTLFPIKGGAKEFIDLTQGQIKAVQILKTVPAEKQEEALKSAKVLEADTKFAQDFIKKY